MGPIHSQGSVGAQDPAAPVTRAEFAALVDRLDLFLGAYLPPQQPPPSAPQEDGVQQSENGGGISEPRASGPRVSEEEVRQNIPDPGVVQPPPQPVLQAQHPPQLVVHELVMGPLERAQRLGITHFEGTTDPAVALSWWDSVEGIYTYLHLSDAEKMEATVFLLRGPALFWWKTVKGRYPSPAVVTWQMFEREFRQKYVSPTHIEDRRESSSISTVKGYDSR